jgi:aryl-alcohol dehydrogenase-like predicted oxidoreductase
MNAETLIPGHATMAATRQYVQDMAQYCPKEHFSDFLNVHLQLSSLGVGTFPGAPTDEVNEAYVEIVARALTHGINVIDTGTHYRYGKSALAVGAGLRQALAAGKPADLSAWFAQEIVAKGLGKTEDLTQMHCISPAYIAWQLEVSRRLMGVETLDAFLIDQPEVHISAIGKEALNKKLLAVFEVLENAVKLGRLRYYGITTFQGFRVETDNLLFQSLTSLLGLADQAARKVGQSEQAKHHFKLVQMPFNQVMQEGFTRFSQATGQDNIASTIQAAHQLGVYLMASHSLFKGKLATVAVDAVLQSMPLLANDAQRAMQFNRSTPGVGTSLVGISTPAHLDDMLDVARLVPMEKTVYLKMYERTE